MAVKRGQNRWKWLEAADVRNLLYVASEAHLGMRKLDRQIEERRQIGWSVYRGRHQKELPRNFTLSTDKKTWSGRTKNKMAWCLRTEQANKHNPYRWWWWWWWWGRQAGILMNDSNRTRTEHDLITMFTMSNNSTTGIGSSSSDGNGNS
jgi:hypothetical protein